MVFHHELCLSAKDRLGKRRAYAPLFGVAALAEELKADTQLAIDKLRMLYDSLAQEYFSIE